MTDEQFSEILTRLAKISDRQKAIARAVADIAVALNTAHRLQRDEYAELQGLLLGALHEMRAPAARERRDSQDTKKFPLPGGEEGDALQLTKRTQRKILKWVILATAGVLLHVLQWWMHAHGLLGGG